MLLDADPTDGIDKIGLIGVFVSLADFLTPVVNYPSLRLAWLIEGG